MRAGVDDRQVNAAERGAHAVKRGLQAGAIGDVGGRDMRLSIRQGDQRCLIAARQRHSRVTLHQ